MTYYARTEFGGAKCPRIIALDFKVNQMTPTPATGDVVHNEAIQTWHKKIDRFSARKCRGIVNDQTLDSLKTSENRQGCRGVFSEASRLNPIWIAVTNLVLREKRSLF